MQILAKPLTDINKPLYEPAPFQSTPLNNQESSKLDSLKSEKANLMKQMEELDIDIEQTKQPLIPTTPPKQQAKETSLSNTESFENKTDLKELVMTLTASLQESDRQLEQKRNNIESLQKMVESGFYKN